MHPNAVIPCDPAAGRLFDEISKYKKGDKEIKPMMKK